MGGLSYIIIETERLMRDSGAANASVVNKIYACEFYLTAF